MRISLLILLLLNPWLTAAQLELMPAETIPAVFSGEMRPVQVVFRNPSEKEFEVKLWTRILQSSSATTMPIGPAQPWKNFRVLAGQTVTDSISLSFPEVKAATHFLVQWLDADGKEFGKTDVLVYPLGLLAPLKPLANGKALGVCDPQNQLKPLLNAAKVEFDELEQTGWKKFNGKLAIIGPFANPEQVPSDLGEKIKSLAKPGTVVVWIQLPTGNLPKLEPTLYTVRAGTGHIVVAPARTVANLAENPLSQLNLIRLAKFGLHPEQMELPPLKP